jgi:hypothetical protein
VGVVVCGSVFVKIRGRGREVVVFIFVVFGVGGDCLLAFLAPPAFEEGGPLAADDPDHLLEFAHEQFV